MQESEKNSQIDFWGSTELISEQASEWNPVGEVKSSQEDWKE